MGKIGFKKEAAADVPTPEVDKVRLFVDEADGFPAVKDETDKVTSFKPSLAEIKIGNEYLSPTGVAAKDTAAWQGATDALASKGGGDLLLGGGATQFLIDGSLGMSACLVNHDLVRVIGCGRDITSVKRADGTNKDFYTGDRYGAGGVNGGIQKAGLEGMTIDGNLANNAGGGSYGIKADGPDPRFRDLDIRNFKRPLWSTLSRSVAYPADTEDALVEGLRIHGHTEEGFRWDGPHDSQGHDIWVWSDTGINFIVNVVSIWRGVHSFGVAENLRVEANGGGSKFHSCTLEGAGTGTGGSGKKLVILASYVYFEGEIFAAGGGDSLKGVQIGDSTHTLAYTLLDIRTRGLTNGILWFENAVNDKGRFRIHSQESSGFVINGTFNPVNNNDFRQVVCVNGMSLAASGVTSLQTVNSAATLSLPQQTQDQTVRVFGTATVTSINILPARSRVTLISGDNPGVAYTDGGNLKLAGNFATANFNDSITLVSDGTNWVEAGRSHN